MIHKAYYNISVQKLPIFLCHTRIWDTSMKIHQYFLLRNVILTSILITKTSLKNIFSQQNQNKFIWLFTRLLEFKTGILLSVVSQLSKLTDVSHHKGELSFVSKLRLQLMYDLWELFHKIWGILFRRPTAAYSSRVGAICWESTQMCEKQMKNDVKKSREKSRKKKAANKKTQKKKTQTKDAKKKMRKKTWIKRQIKRRK